MSKKAPSADQQATSKAARYIPATHARNIRKHLEYPGPALQLDELKGKYIEYVDRDGKWFIQKVVDQRSDRADTVKTVDGAGDKHDVPKEQIVAAYQRKNSSVRCKVVG